MDCQSAALILSGLAPDMEYPAIEAGSFGMEACEALRHYAKCPTCRPQGLASMMLPAGRMACQEAIRVALGNSSLLFSFMSSGFKTLREVIAHEHIYGVHTYRGGRFVDPKYAYGAERSCCEPVCRKTRDIWNLAPLCSHYDGDRELEYGPTRVLALAKKSGWNLEPLMAMLRDRLRCQEREYEAYVAKWPGSAHDRQLGICGARSALQEFAQLALSL